MNLSDFLLGISSAHYAWETLPKAFARAQDLGFALIEFSTTQLAGEDYERCAELAAQTGMQLSLHAWLDIASLPLEEARQGLEAVLSNAQAATARYVIVHLGSHPQRPCGLKKAAAVCAHAAPLFEAAGVLLCLENHYPYDYRGLNEIGGEPADFLPIFAATPSPALRFCLDYGHAHMTGNTTAFLERLAPWLAYTHIADNNGQHDEHLAAGEGTIDWPAVLRQTLAGGFTGPFVLEYPEQGKPERFARFWALLQAAASA